MIPINIRVHINPAVNSTKKPSNNSDKHSQQHFWFTFNDMLAGNIVDCTPAVRQIGLEQLARVYGL